MNIMPKHDGQATVASRDSQNAQRDASVELAAPQFGQLRVSACMEANSNSLHVKVDYKSNAVRCFPRKVYRKLLVCVV